MTTTLKDLLQTMPTIKISNGVYYNLKEFNNILNRMAGQQIEVEDTILMPFYIRSSRVLEIYDYAINIRLVDLPNEENYILAKTGKDSMNEVDADLREKLSSCYLEVIKPEKFLLIDGLNECVNYVLTSPELRKRIYDYLHEFDDNKFYFEFY